ncbi:unannotated protein [freshwater metagenome]|uniref:Unannotated protein n=1 Tax=freshwater metagenome TaxID=449393 RepID=A0A6J6GZ35_9ZZZZ
MTEQTRAEREQQDPQPIGPLHPAEIGLGHDDQHRHRQRTDERHHEHEPHRLDAVAHPFRDHQVRDPHEQRHDGPHVADRLVRLTAGGRRGSQHRDHHAADGHQRARDLHRVQPFAEPHRRDRQRDHRGERSDDQRDRDAHVLQRDEERADVEAEQHAERRGSAEVGPARHPPHHRAHEQHHGRGGPHPPEAEHHAAGAGGLAEHPAERPEDVRHQHGGDAEHTSVDGGLVRRRRHAGPGGGGRVHDDIAGDATRRARAAPPPAGPPQS